MARKDYAETVALSWYLILNSQDFSQCSEVFHVAEIVVSVKEDQDLGIFEIVGDLQSGELSKSLIDNHDAYMKKRHLLDFSRGKLSSMDLDTLINRTRSSKIFDREGTRIAFFLPDDLEFGTGMMVKSYAESFGYLAEISVFRCVNEALNWLTAE